MSKGFIMGEHPFRIFIDLIRFDQETQALQQDLRTLEDDSAELKKKKKQLILVLADMKKATASLKKEVDANELLMKELDQLEAEKKKRLDTVSNQREYRSIQAELASVNRKQKECEERLIELWNKYEAAKKQYETHLQERGQKEQELDRIIEEKQAAIADCIGKIEQREKDRSAMEKGIPEEWLEKYAAMRIQVVNPVVPVVGGSCSACFYPVPRQDLLLLQTGKLRQCKSCYRLLYLKEQVQEEEVAEQEKEQTSG
jgi:predicted  nucleic acid-binding Zn-ribbon protein